MAPLGHLQTEARSGYGRAGMQSPKPSFAAGLSLDRNKTLTTTPKVPCRILRAEEGLSCGDKTCRFPNV